MGKVAIIYKSIHHGNTKKLLDGLKKSCEFDLIEAEASRKMEISNYDTVGYIFM